MSNIVYIVLILVLVGQGGLSLFTSRVQGWMPWGVVKNVDSGLTAGYSSMMSLPAAVMAK